MNRGKSQALRKWVGIFFSLGFLGWCFYYLRQDPTRLEPLFHIQGKWMALLLGLQATFYGCNGRIVQEMLRKLGLTLSVAESFWLSILSSAANTFLPMSSGVVFRTYYLKKYRGFSLTNSVSFLLRFYVLAYWIACWGGSISSYVLWSHGHFQLQWVGLLFLSGIVVGGVFLCFFPKFSCFFETGGHIRLVVLAIMNQFLFAMMIWVAAYAIDLSVSWDQALFLSCLQYLTFLLPLTPGNIGVTEGILATGAHLIGIPVSQMIVVVFLLRGGALLVLLGLLPFSLYGLFRTKWKISLREATENLKR